MKISLLHTAEIHVATFDSLFKASGVDVELTHHVEESLLARAINDGTDTVKDDVIQRLQNLSYADAVLCTCSTLGPIADTAPLPHLIRIDRPMMEAACAAGPRILVAICLESTRAATIGLLQETAAAMGADIDPELLLCADAWPEFLAGNTDAFSRAIAAMIKQQLAQRNADCIVLGQASMRGAKEHLRGTGIPIFSSPDLAVQAVLDLA